MRFLFFVLFFFFSELSLAGTAISELNWQAPGGTIVVIPTYRYETLDIEDTDEKVTGVGTGAGLELQYGLLNVFAVGTRFVFDRLDTRKNDFSVLDEETREGFNDYEVFAKFIWPLTRTRVHFGISYLMSSEASNFNSGSLRGNRFSGGNSMKPYLSVQFPMGPFWIGFFGEWTLNSEKTIKSSGILTETVTGGDVLDVLFNFEYNSGMNAFGVAAGTLLTQAKETTNISTSVITESESFQKLHGRVYFKTRLMKHAAFILKVDYFDTTEQELGSNVTRTRGIEMRGESGLRIMF